MRHGSHFAAPRQTSYTYHFAAHARFYTAINAPYTQRDILATYVTNADLISCVSCCAF